MQTNVLKELIQNCEAHLRAGEGHLVGRRLAKLNTAQVPDEFRVALAHICRRAGLINVGLKLLTPVVHPAHTLRPASDAEKAEYAVLLQRSGVVSEALKILREVDSVETPQTLLYQAFCHFNVWNYEDSVPLLRKYVLIQTDPYSRLIGKVNLAAALVNLDSVQPAVELLGELIQETQAGNSLRLLGNSLELRAQLFLRMKLIRQAEADVNEALRLLGSQRTHDQLFVRQWQAVIEAQKTGETAPLQNFKMEALERGHFESVREADLNLLSVRFDQKLYERLQFGTPWDGYHRHIERVIGSHTLPDIYFRGSMNGPVWNSATGELYPRPEINIPDRIHRLLSFLNRDAYRPKPLGMIFSELFEGEHFNVFSSPNRVHQVVKRARRWLEANDLAASIVNEKDAYRFQIDGDFSVMIHREKKSLEAKSVLFARIQNQIPVRKSFSSSDVMIALGSSKTSANELMKWAKQSGQVEVLGQGRSTKYRRIA